MLSAELKLVAKANDFIWLRQETGNYHSNLMLQFIANADSLQDQITVRNLLTKNISKLRKAPGLKSAKAVNSPFGNGQ